jgi:hypothetical protein
VAIDRRAALGSVDLDPRGILGYRYAGLIHHEKERHERCACKYHPDAFNHRFLRVNRLTCLQSIETCGCCQGKPVVMPRQIQKLK